MGKWNEEAAPNNNLSEAEIHNAKFVPENRKNDRKFSEELADGGERDEFIKRQEKNMKEG